VTIAPTIDQTKSALYSKMTTKGRQVAVRNLLWGYDDEDLQVDDLVQCVTGAYGPRVAKHFIETLRNGFTLKNSTHVRSFSSMCVFYGQYEVLETMAAIASRVVVPERLDNCSKTFSTSEWLDWLSTRITRDDHQICFPLLQQATELPDESAKKVIDFALRHQPEHPDIEVLLAKGGKSAAYLAEALMRRKIGEAVAIEAPAARAAPMTQRRSAL